MLSRVKNMNKDESKATIQKTQEENPYLTEW